MNVNHVEITTTVPCINSCLYCPQKVLGVCYRGPKYMTQKTFSSILSNIPVDVAIHFSGFSEPFGNKSAINFIEEAVIQGHEVAVYTTLAGITDAAKERLKSVPIKLLSLHLRTGEEDIENSAEIYQRNRVEKAISRAGNNYQSEEKQGRVICSRNAEYKQNVVLPNGDLYLCCMDYGLEHKLGNLIKQRFSEIKRDNHYSLCKKCEMSLSA